MSGPLSRKSVELLSWLQGRGPVGTPVPLAWGHICADIGIQRQHAWSALRRLLDVGAVERVTHGSRRDPGTVRVLIRVERLWMSAMGARYRELETIVQSEMRNAAENGYADELTALSSLQLAIDLLHCSSELEGCSLSEVQAVVRALRRDDLLLPPEQA